MSINRAPLFYQQTNADGTVVLRPVSESVPPHDAMVPGKLYVRKLPGRKRPEWVRKRVPSAYSPFGFTAIAEAFGGPRAPSCSTDDSVQDIRTYSTAPNQYLHPFQFPQPLQVQSPGQTVTVTQDPGVYTQEVQAPTIVQATPGLKTTVITETGGKSVEKHTCASCGKYRSASYQLRHPLRPGEKPKAKMCKKCAKQETSSEDSDSSHKTHHKRNRKKKHYRKHSTESDESSSDKERSRRHRCRSSRHRSRRSDTRSSSVDGIRITIAKSTDEPRSRLAARRKRSPDSIRIMRHTRYMNRTEPEFHHRSRDSSDRHYTRESEARGYDGIDRVYISRREPSPRYRETEYFGGYDTVDRERPVRRRSESLLVRRRTPQGHQGHYERPSVSHVRDIDDYVGDSAYESGGSVVEIDPPRPPSRLVRVRSSPEAESRSRPRSVRAIRVAHVPDEPRRRSRSRSRSRSVRAIRVAHVSDEPRRRSRSRSVRAIRIAHVSDEPRPRSQSVRYLRVQQPDRSYESVPADEPRVFVQSRARSPTPIRRHFTETLESPRRPRRRRYREGSEFQASSEDLNVLESPISSEHFARAVTVSRPVRFVRTRRQATESDSQSDYAIPRSSIPGVSYVHGRNHSHSRHQATDSDPHVEYEMPRSSIPGVSYVRGRDISRSRRSESYQPSRSRQSSMARGSIEGARYMDPVEREAYVGLREQYDERAMRAMRAREGW